MTAPQNAPAGVTKDAASARKRRRRAPAGGAADDCFTCAKRNVKCDRRRPYCSQCLEIGNECSGYKTQLTWGVGVASRGKLRGLSLPIAKAPPVNPVKKSPIRPRVDSTVTPIQWNEQEEQQMCREDVEMQAEQPPTVPPTPFHPYDLSHISSPENTPVISQASWSSIHHFPSNMSASEGHHQYQNGNLHLTVPGTNGMLATSVDSISEVDYMSPLAHSFPRDDISFIHSPTAMYESFQPHGSPVTQTPVSAMMIEPLKAPTSCPSLAYCPSEPSSGLQSHVDNYDAQLSHKLMQGCESLIPRTPDLDVYSTNAHSHGPFWAPSIPEEEQGSRSISEHSPNPWPVAFGPHSLSVSSDLMAKMPFFMDYYEHTMCPSLVFIDGPNNPFRDHILQLAGGSRSLQHAICALAACNLRMKRKLSLGQHGIDTGEKRLDTTLDPMSDPQPEDQAQLEEYRHRNLAVHLLNEQLNDTDKSVHDSVLATILLLCHYRMAESGIAKFHTQFAGVREILSMRRTSPFPSSRDSVWMEALFTYFDAISASINERETQVNTSFYGVIPDAQLLPPGAENLVGCDRELFKTIIKLGRLNLLSQHRPVQNLLSSTLSRRASSRPQSPHNSPIGRSYTPSYSQHAHHLSVDPHIFPRHGSRFDSSGFYTTLGDEEAMSTATLHSPIAYDDLRSTFWREWKDARVALQSWEFDSQRVVAGLLPGSATAAAAVVSPAAGMHSPTISLGPGGGPGLSHPHGTGHPTMVVTPAQVRDLGSLSEAFRYAALLYTERLASPNVPSAHSNFRNLVSQVVYYATSLEAGSNAEKFLLWPLFVAGSECVNELQQNIVRSKCREIMARSGYMNNLAALDILERLWAGDWKEEGPSSKMMGLARQGPFNWTKCIGGPGVEVEWIMF